MHPDEGYKLLLARPSDSLETPLPIEDIVVPQNKRTLHRIIAVQGVVNVILLLALLWVGWTRRVPPLTELHSQLYSPADEAVVYEEKVFIPDFRSRSIYTRYPSEEVDRAWDDLYNDFGLTEVTAEQARLLPNTTVPIPGRPGKYIVALSVFHQLHCLNDLRKSLYPEYYSDVHATEGVSEDDRHHHLTHCVDTLRQGIMCASDISSIVWHWSEEKNRALVYMDVPHLCRNFDRIVDWAKAHKVQQEFDPLVHVQDVGL